MIRNIRAVTRLLLLTIYTLTTFGIYLLGKPLFWLFRLPPEPWRNLFMRSWARAVVFLFNIDIQSEGKAPDAPFFIVSNHMGYVDIVPLYIHLRCTFVAKQEVRHWPVLGFMVKAVGVIFIDRTKRRDVKRVNELLNSVLNKYQGLIVFPEGTSSNGSRVLPFHSSLLQLPAEANQPVHYCSLYYETAEGDLPAVESVCFYGGKESFTSHIVKFAKTSKVTCKIRFGPEPVQSTDRKVLADTLQQKLTEIFEPTSDEKDVQPA